MVQPQNRDGRISVTEVTIEEIDTSVKENIKSKKFLAQNVQELWVKKYK